MADSEKKRNQIVISDVPKKLFDKISSNAKKKRNSNGVEVLNFLEEKKYK